jgi:hypothetical protein
MFPKVNIIALRKIVPVMRATALFTRQRRKYDELSHRMKVSELERTPPRRRNYAKPFQMPLQPRQSRRIPQQPCVLPHALLQFLQQSICICRRV